jgi:hypothetical protein
MGVGKGSRQKRRTAMLKKSAVTQWTQDYYTAAAASVIGWKKAEVLVQTMVDVQSGKVDESVLAPLMAEYDAISAANWTVISKALATLKIS